MKINMKKHTLLLSGSSFPYKYKNWCVALKNCAVIFGVLETNSAAVWVGVFGGFCWFAALKPAKCYLSNTCRGKNHHPKQNRAISEICTAISYKQPIEFNVTNDKDLEYIMSLVKQVLWKLSPAICVTSLKLGVENE